MSHVLIRPSKLCFNPVLDSQESCFSGSFDCLVDHLVSRVSESGVVVVIVVIAPPLPPPPPIREPPPLVYAPTPPPPTHPHTHTASMGAVGCG